MQNLWNDVYEGTRDASYMGSHERTAMTPRQMEDELSDISSVLSGIKFRIENVVEIKMKEVERHSERTSDSDGAGRKGRRTLHERLFGRRNC